MDKTAGGTLPFDLGPYATVPEYIYGITREIWEDRGVGAKLAKYYAPDVVVRAPTGVTVGNEGVTGQTLQTLHQFPDRQLVGEDVIWRPTANRGFLSSHRLISVMRHTGDGIFGKASGNAVRSYIIADCWVQDAQVKEEWLVRDQAAFARCLRREPRDLAAEMIERERRRGLPISFYSPAQDRPSRYAAVVEDEPAVTRHCTALQALWGGKELAAIRALYFSGATLHGPGGDAWHGHGEIDRFVVGYLAAFPHATFRIDSAFVNREPELPLRIAVRWSLAGIHSGFGRFGEPTGAPVHVMGISHAHVTDGRVRQEWLLTDEVSIWKQILSHTTS